MCHAMFTVLQVTGNTTHPHHAYFITDMYPFMLKSSLRVVWFKNPVFDTEAMFLDAAAYAHT